VQEDLVAVEQRLVLVDAARHQVAELPDLLLESRPDVLEDPADLEIAGCASAGRTDISKRSRIVFALAKQYQNIEIAPRSSRGGAEPDERASGSG